MAIHARRKWAFGSQFSSKFQFEITAFNRTFSWSFPSVRDRSRKQPCLRLVGREHASGVELNLFDRSLFSSSALTCASERRDLGAR